ncbi:hypothetical protein BC829DRAFT_413334 [Chytridium lagenaria]|nr:hypothetical protein BC829DRAFT_413334 [Chytridium lagenaria]
MLLSSQFWVLPLSSAQGLWTFVHGLLLQMYRRNNNLMPSEYLDVFTTPSVVTARLSLLQPHLRVRELRTQRLGSQIYPTIAVWVLGTPPPCIIWVQKCSSKSSAHYLIQEVLLAPDGS